MITYSEFRKYIEDCVGDILESVTKGYITDVYQLHEVIHDHADGSQFVIYYSQAWDLVTMLRQDHYTLFCDATDEEQQFDGKATDLDTIMTRVAYCAVRMAIEQAIADDEIIQQLGD